jgi:hypothetical protein
MYSKGEKKKKNGDELPPFSEPFTIAQAPHAQDVQSIDVLRAPHSVLFEQRLFPSVNKDDDYDEKTGV